MLLLDLSFVQRAFVARSVETGRKGEVSLGSATWLYNISPKHVFPGRFLLPFYAIPGRFPSQYFYIRIEI